MLLLLLLTLCARADSPPSDRVELTTAELAHHDRRDSCWMLIDGTVYDLTNWVAGHPGGDAILRGCGKDASDFFVDRDGQGTAHSEGARQVLATFALGPLGATVDVGPPPPGPHPFDQRLEGSRTGFAPTAGVGPAHSIYLRVVHGFSTRPDAVPNGMVASVGYSFGFLDLGLTDVRAAGLGALEAKARLLDQHGRQPMPLSLSLAAGGGYATVAEESALYGSLVAQRDLWDRRLALRASGTLGHGQGTTGSVGGGLELRPIPIHSLFVDLQLPLADPSRPAWSAGARLFTHGHSFVLYVASTPVATPWELAGPAPDALTVGGAFEKAFQL